MWLCDTLEHYTNRYIWIQSLKGGKNAWFGHSFPSFSIYCSITEWERDPLICMSCKLSWLCMRGNYSAICRPEKITGQPANVKMVPIMVTRVSKQQLDPLVYAWWVRVLLRPSHLTSYAPHRVTVSKGCASSMCVYACVSALIEWAISVSSSFRAVSELALPTWCPLDEVLRWHLSVSGPPSVAPSISLADSRGPGASLTPSLHRLHATMPALTHSSPFTVHEQMHANTHTHIHIHPYGSHSPWTLPESSDLEWLL